MVSFDALKTAINGLRYWTNNNFINKNEDFSDEVIDMLIELDALPAVADADGAILTDESGAILMM